MRWSLECPHCGTVFQVQVEGEDESKVPRVPPHGPPDDTAIDCPGGHSEANNPRIVTYPGPSRPRP